MTCAEFQKVLPDIMDTGGNAEAEAHQRICEACAELVADLTFIAEQARLLAPTLEPDPRVWERIQAAVEREGLARPAATPLVPAPVAVMPGRWGWATGLSALAAMLLFAVGVFVFRSATSSNGIRSAMNAPAAVSVAMAIDDDDVRLLQAIADRSPAARAAYEDSLKSVNAYIADARTTLANDPGSEEAHNHLMLAYNQKAMLYQMALSRSLE